MRHRHFIAVLAVFAALAAIPAAASASLWSVQSAVARDFGRQVRNNASLSGIRVLSTSVTCRSVGGGVYNCLGKYTVSKGGYRAQYGIYIRATNYAYHTVGHAFAM